MLTINVEPIELPELTTEIVAGTGAFDVMMRAAYNQLDSQLVKGVITKQQYSELQLQLITTTMSQAIQFLQVRHAADIAFGQLQIAQAGLGIQEAQLEIQREQLQLQKDKAAEEIRVLEEQANAFETDSLYKVAKLYADRWSVTATIDQATTADDLNKLGDNYVGSALETLLNKVGIPIPEPIPK